MNNIDPSIIRFIKKHHVLTLATVRDNMPWCSNIFYAYSPERNLFVFTSDKATRHGAEALDNSRVAASIVLETRIVGKIQGLQIAGQMRNAGTSESWAQKVYLKRFPYAAVAPLELWILEPDLYKLTDNTLGFGKKIVWQSDK